MSADTTRVEFWRHAGTSVDYAARSHLAGRVEAMLALWPVDARTALDAGCGRGEMLAALRGHGVRAFGVDFARDGSGDARANMAALPIRSASVDAVLASEVLEHLPAEELERALGELRRVARRWVMITVPLDEQLEFEQVTCASCRGRFNTSGHLRVVRRADVLAWFGGWRLAAERAVGTRRLLWPPAMRVVAALAGARNLSWEAGAAACPMCGAATPFVTHRDGLWPQALLRARGLLWRLGRRAPLHGAFLFERR